MKLNIFLSFCIFFKIAASAPTQVQVQGERNVDEDNLFETDIILSPEQKQQIEAATNKVLTLSERKAQADLQYRWLNGVVPYLIDSSFSAARKSTIMDAIEHIQDRTCVRFSKYNTNLGDTNRVKITRPSQSDKCSSNVGKQFNDADGEQSMNFGDDCSFGSGVHELLHTLGLWHEQSRTDRDNFVIIHDDNIEDGRENNFLSYDINQIADLGVPYDYGSIMHYGGTFFSKNGEFTIETIDPAQQNVIGQRVAMSELDAGIINTMYNCEESCKISNVGRYNANGGTQITLTDGSQSMTADECVALCDRDPDCKAVDYNTGNQDCWSHQTTAGRVHVYDCCDRYEKTCTVLNPCKITNVGRYNANGGTQVSLPSGSATMTGEECANICEFDTGCKAVDYNTNNQLCYSHTTTAGRVHDYDCCDRYEKPC